MDFRVNWAKVTFEHQFSQPFLMLATSSNQVLESFYRALAPRFRGSTSDFSVEPSRTIAGVVLQAHLFGGNAIINLSPDRLRGEFAPVGPNDEELIKDLVQSALGSVTELDSSASLALQTTTYSAYIELLDAQADSWEFLRQAAPTGAHAVDLPSSLTNVDTIPGLRLDFVSEERGYVLHVGLDRSTRSRKEMFVTASSRFEATSSIQLLDERTTLLKYAVDSMLTKLSLIRRSDDTNA
jgi:hypothetical protein